MKGGCVWVTCTLNTRVTLITRVARDQDELEVKSMIDLVLVKKDMQLCCKVRLMGTCIKRIEVVNGAKRKKSEKPREHQYKEEYDAPLEGKRVE